jgi:hypothetical protein
MSCASVRASARSTNPSSIINMHTDKNMLFSEWGTCLMKAIAAEDVNTLTSICRTGSCSLSDSRV